MNNNEGFRKVNFANYSRRIQAALLDGLIYLLFFLIIIVTVSQTDLHHWTKLGIFASLMLLFEPMLVSFTGASLGHHMKGLRVEQDANGQNINFLQAIFRFIIKTLLGIFSLVFFLTTKRHKALHDMAVNSVVVMNKASIKKGIVGTPERVFEEDGFKNASKIRRVIAIILYTLTMYIIISLTSLILVSEPCLFDDLCSLREDIALSILGFVFMGLFLAIFYFGWHSKLWGCRRSKVR